MATKKTTKKKTRKKSSKKKKTTKKKSTRTSIGKWGSLTFTVTASKQKTFSDLNRTTSIRYESKERKKKVSKVKYKGIDPDKITFTMRFSVFAGANPLTEMNKLTSLARKAKAYRLIIGGKKYGSHKWVITGITRDCDYYNKKGQLWVADVKITMQEKP